MARKTLDVTAITNELEHSAFFPASALSITDELSPTDPTDSVGSAEPMGTLSGEYSSRSSLSPTQSPTHSQHAQPTSTEPLSHPPSSPRPTPPATAPAIASVVAPVVAPVMHAATGAARTPQGQNEPETSTQIRDQASADASTLAREHAVELAPTPAPPRPLQAGDLIERVRRRVRHFGKEVVYVRLTPEEKRQLAEIAYAYKTQDIRTSENEIGRIGLNWLLEDYHDNGANSVLAQVLAALNA